VPEQQGSNATQVARAIHTFAEDFFRETFRGLDTWARQCSNAERRQCPSKEARGTISGRAVMTGEGALAHVQCVSLIGLYMEYGTGIYGPEQKPIRAKGGSYINAMGGRGTRSMLKWKTDRTSYTDRFGRTRKLNGYMYAFEVQGMPASPWFFPTLDAMLTTVRAHIANALQRALIHSLSGVAGAKLLAAELPPIPALPPVRLKEAMRAAKKRAAGVRRMQAKFKRKIAAIQRRGRR
jgi:hypothetical protein